MRALSIVVAFIIAAQISLTLWFLFLSDRVRELETDVHDLEKKEQEHYSEFIFDQIKRGDF